MNCKVEKNAKNGKINKILDASGNESTLFQELLNVPVLSLNETIETYKNIYSDKLKDTIKFQILGEKGAKNLDKIEEATFRMDNLKVAREMEAAGKTPKEIRLATGWEKGVDGLFRYEIQDGTLKEAILNFTNKDEMFENLTAVVKLPNIYSNNELLKAYPKLKETEVIFFDTEKELYNSNLLFVYRDKIYINNRDYEKWRLEDKSKKLYNGSTFEQVLAHELSHLIQTTEGFAQGSSEQFNKELARESISFFRNRTDKLSKRNNDDGRYDAYIERTLRNTLGDGVADDILSTNNIPLELVVNAISNKLYKNFAGEVEGRNVQTRFFMSPQERLEQTLQETQDIPFEDQFVYQLKNGIQSTVRTAPQITQEIIDKLKQNGLSEDVFLLSTEEINAKLKELGVSEDVRKQVEAWHGSPYAFDRFEFSDRTFLSGESAAAFGAGLYFTSLEDIARNYAENEELITKHIEKQYEFGTPDRFYQIPEEKRKNKERLTTYIDTQIKGFEGVPYQQTEWQRLKDAVQSYKSNLYKVSLHKGKTPSEYTWLEWDKPVNDSYIKKINEFAKENINFKTITQIFNGKLEYLILGEGDVIGKVSDVDSESEAISKFKEQNPNLIKEGTGKNVYQRLMVLLGSDKRASVSLLNIGIDGIKYPAESLALGATSDTARGFNYVVFDENSITIEEQIQFSKSLNSQVIGEQGANRVEEYKNLLNQAKDLEKQGKDYSQTGWFKTENNEWKYFSNEYVNQFKFKENLKLNQEQNFEDVIEDNVIFQLYPEAKKLKIVLYDNKYTNPLVEGRISQANGAYSKDQNTIFVNVENADGKGMEHIIGHELNHFTQGMEGFSTGGDGLSTLFYALESTNYNRKGAVGVREYLVTYDRTTLSKNDSTIFDNAIKVYDAFKKNDKKTLSQYYDRIEGEVDSRAVEAAITIKNKFGSVKATYKELKDELLKQEGINPAEVISLYYKGFEYNVGINLITNGLTYKDSKTGKDIVILNKDTATDETLVHEFSHVFSKWQKENRPELWKKGQDLAKNAIKSGEIKDIVSYVKQTQPKLKEGTEAFYDEVLQEYVGRTSKEMMDEQKAKSPLMQWLSDFWASIADLFNIFELSSSEIANLTLKDFADYSISALLNNDIMLEKLVELNIIERLC